MTELLLRGKWTAKAAVQINLGLHIGKLALQKKIIGVDQLTFFWSLLGFCRQGIISSLSKLELSLALVTVNY